MKDLFSSFFFCSGLLLAAPLSAIETDDPDLGGGFIEGPEWKEGNVVIPPYPQIDELIKIQLDRADQPFNFYLDPKSVAIGEDGVVRYTVVIESYSGARNVLYEGIRCETEEYRAYAYGTSDGKFSKATVANWTRFRQSDGMTHRYNFYKYYMCDELKNVLPRNGILQRVRYPEDFMDLGERGD